MARSAEELKQLSIKEFTEAAKVYESGHAGIYEMRKDDYPQMLEELELEPFEDALDVGCGTGAVLELLHARYPNKHLTGLDLTPGMIDVARAKQLDNVSFVVGDAEALPFEPRSFDAVLCSNSFHHYPHPKRFFAEVARVLRPGGRLVLRDYTSNDVAVWLMNNIELPLARLLGHGDVRILKLSELRALAEGSGLTLLKLEAQKGFRAHMVAKGLAVRARTLRHARARRQRRQTRARHQTRIGHARTRRQTKARRHKRDGAPLLPDADDVLHAQAHAGDGDPTAGPQRDRLSARPRGEARQTLSPSARYGHIPGLS